jgi:hypothetical protein
MTLAGAFEWYFKARARKRSREADRRISEHLLEEFGAATRLRDLTASRIAAYRERRLAAGSVRRKDETGKPARLSAASINRPLAVLRHLLRLAQEEWEGAADRSEGSAREGAAGPPPVARARREAPTEGSTRAGFEVAVEAARLAGPFRFHDCRHHFASWFMMRGGSLPALQKILGHATLAMTMRCAHLSPEQGRASAQET